GAPAGWLARKIAARELSSVEVVRAHLEHIHTVNPRLNAVVFATAESAIKEARAADRRNKPKSVLGRLHGVPFTAKDIFNTAGLAGGSSRLPAHYCGVAALKPTAGLIPVTGAYGLAGGVTDTRSQVGPMARYVSDLRIALRVLAGPDGIDSGVVPVRAWRSPRLEGLHVAWYADDGMARPTSAVAATVKAAEKALSQAGCIVTEERPPSLRDAYQVTLAFWGRKHMSHERMYERWDAFRSTVLRFMSRFDLVLSPVAPDIAPLLRLKPAGNH